MNKDKYDTLKNALIIEKDEKLLEEFKKLMIDMDKEQNNLYEKNYKKYDYMSLTIEEEEDRISNIISLIKERQLEHNLYEDDYNYITGDVPDFLSQILYIEELKEFEQKLDTIKDYLAIKERIVNLSININDYKKELSINSNNRRLNTKLNKSTRKVNDLLKQLKKENILILLYEFCIIDTFDKNKIDNGILLRNILSSDIKKKKKQVQEYEKEESNTIDDNKAEIEEKLSNVEEKNEDEADSNVKEEVSEDKDSNIESNDLEDVSDDSSTIEESNIISSEIPILEHIGTVKPVSMMEKLEKAQKEEDNLTIPSMGILDTDESVKIDSNDFVKNTTKSDKIS